MSVNDAVRQGKTRRSGSRLRTWCAIGLVACAGSGAAAAQAQADPFELTVNHAVIDLGALKGLEILDNVTGDAHFSGTIDGNQVTIPADGLNIPPKSITDPFPVTIQIKANDALTGTYDAATGALTLNANLRAETSGGATCTITPIVLTLSTAATSPYLGVPFAGGLNGSGAIVAPWTTLPKSLGGGFCDVLGQLSAGPGGLWLSHDIATPAVYVPPGGGGNTPGGGGNTPGGGTDNPGGGGNTPGGGTDNPGGGSGTKAAKLSAKVGGLSVKAGKTATFTVKLKNAGDAASKKVKVCVSGAKGLKASACATVNALAAGASKSVKLKVKTARKNKGHTYSLKFKATSSGLDTKSATAKLKVR